MKLYLTVIGIAASIIAAVNIALGTGAWYYIIAVTVWCVALQFAIDGSIAIIIKLTPDRWYKIDSPAYRVSKREVDLYLRLGVRRWKDKVWELGGIGGFSKRALLEPNNPAYIEKFIIECHKGVLTHRLSYPAGFLAMLTVWSVCSFTVALPVALVNLYLNILPTVVLRYNTPKLQSALKRLRNRQGVI
ncbi:MAG: hypothetical protein IKA64_05995 [Clostridia bacterium]|nr:hypothetical protein [Clostridia bacterium]